MTFYFNALQKGNMTFKEAFDAEIEALEEILSEGVVTVRFRKIDGTIREIKGTTSAPLIADIDDNKLPHTQSKVYDDKIVRFFDVEIGDWRSFYKDNVIDFWNGPRPASIPAL